MMSSWWNRLLKLLTIEPQPSNFTGLPQDEAFERDNEAKTLIGVKHAILYALVFNPAWIALDFSEVSEDLIPLFIRTRIYLEVVLVGIFALTVRKNAEKNTIALGLATIYSAGIAMARLALHHDPYYAGINLVIIGAVLIPWSARPTFMAGGGLYVIYVACLLLNITGKPELANMFWNNSFFMLGSAFVATGVTWYAHNLRREAFYGRYQQARAIDEQQLINAELNRQYSIIQAHTQELAEVNEKLAEQSTKLEEANTKLADQYKIKSQFLDNMSHELRTPLTLIQTPIRMLLDAPLDDEQRAILKDVEYASNQLHEEINQILDLSKYENQKVVLHYEQVDPDFFIRDYLNSWKYKAKEKDLKLEMNAEKNLPKVWLDRREFIKVLRNLISNAVKYTPAQGSIQVSVRTIDIWLEVSVSDTGAGIAPKDQDRLFERFVQADNEETRAQEGTGLGMALVRDIITRHGGGKPTLKSALGQGTTITVQIPLGKPDHVPEPTVSPETSVPESIGSLLEDSVLPVEPKPQRSSILHVNTFLPGFQKERILVVEDNRHLSALLERVLSPTYTILMAEDGVDALEKIGPFEPDLILSDVMMPRMTGTQLLEKIRQDATLARLPFILLTANANVKDRTQGLWSGANDYITKPFDVSELLARINNLLRLKSFERQLSLRNQELFKDKSSLESELRKRFMNTVSVLVGAIDCKDAYTAGHSERVSYYARILAEPFDLRPDELETLELGALMHDVGKIGIPDAVLNKPGKLTDEEHRIIQLHPSYADQILRRAPELDLVRQVVVHHHERWDGKGYPYRLVGENIPVLSRIVSMADCWDAMVSDRIYRKGMDPQMALDLCKKISGTQIEPRLVDSLCQVWERLVPPPHLKPLKALSNDAPPPPPPAPHEARASTCAWNDPALAQPAQNASTNKA